MQTVADRILMRMTELGLQHKDLVVRTGASKGTVTNWLSGANDPTGKRLISLAETLNTTPGWILTGKENQTSYISKVEVWDENSPLEPDEVEIAFYESLRFACGGGSISSANETDKTYMRVPRKLIDQLGVYRDKTFSAPTEDSSMKPTINDGDIVYVDENRNYIKDGKIFAIEHGELFRCKRLYKTSDGGVRIVSDNKDEYPEEVLTKQQIKDQNFRVIGWVWKIDKVESW
ncbi:S24 family peptidase [Acinetobacter haemolyticus]|uniref:S24 family peptidase n=1 Tax=Acinetobacter haemolyticus TaxID=29430 RepID=UPI002A6A1072|nr:S24 family peptidase [Acinetobacter haemolyticus]WPO68747.1 S24 family peptidase [Acinetobacter haemolyticus]